MTLPVAKNCKMTKKSDIDGVINPSKMSDMPQNFLSDDLILLISLPLSITKFHEKFHLDEISSFLEKVVRTEDCQEHINYA